jgi:hypothetical protein
MHLDVDLDGVPAADLDVGKEPLLVERDAIVAEYEVVGVVAPEHGRRVFVSEREFLRISSQVADQVIAGRTGRLVAHGASSGFILDRCV